MRVRVKGGTRSTTQKTLCEGCTRAQITRGMNEAEQIVYCHQLGQRMTFNVEQCSSFNQWGDMTLYEMKEMATIIEPKADGIGFYKPGKFQARFPDRDILPREYEDD